MAKQTDNQVSAVRRAKHGWILTLFFSILAVFYLYPIFLVLINTFKKKGFITKNAFALPDERSFTGLSNFIRGIEKTNFFGKYKNILKKLLTNPALRDKIHHVPNGTYALVAQLDRVTDYESVGRGFESLPSHQKMP